MIRRLAPPILAFGLLLGSSTSQAAPDSGVDVDGHAVLHVVPDRARLSMAAEFTDADAGQAQRAAERVVAAFVKAARQLGVAGDDLATTAIQVAPHYRYDQQQRQLDGYTATRHISVTVRRLDRLAPLLAAASKAGINRVSPPELYSAEAAALSRKALALAAADAQARAQTLAQALGRRLGVAESIQAGDDAPNPPRPMMAFKAAAAEDSAPTMLPGRLEVTATVHVHFALLPP